MSTRHEDFAAYLNARIHGMKSRLLERADFDEMLEADDVQVMVDKLVANDTYGASMADALTRSQGADAVEEGVSRNLVDTFDKLLRTAYDQEFGHLAQIFLTRWDLAAVKSLLRARHHEMDLTDDIEELTPGPSLTMALLSEMASHDSMSALIGALIGWNAQLCESLQKAFADYEQSNDLSILEEALDRSYFLDNIKQLRQRESEDSIYVLRVLQMEIDRINLRILFTMRGDDSGDAIRERLMPNGGITPSVLSAMAEAASPEAAMEQLGTTRYRQLAEGVYTLVQSGRFSQIERLFELEMIHQLRRMARMDVLSIASFMEFGWLKNNEIMNLRLIARGEARHLPRGRVREEMVYA
jgi:ATP synthase A1 C subunit